EHDEWPPRDRRFWRHRCAESVVDRPTLLIHEQLHRLDRFQAPQCLEVKIVSIKFLGSFASRPLYLSVTDRWFNRTNNAGSYLVLKIKNVGKLAIELFSPKMVATGRLDELCGYS